MKHVRQFYIDGAWVDPMEGARSLDVVDPATEKVTETIALGSEADVDRAVKAARAAFPRFAATTKEERIALLREVVEAYQARAGDLAELVRREMGAPVKVAEKAQVPAGLGHFVTMAKVLDRMELTEQRRSTLIVREPVGVCGFITPWNWPLNQIACKVAPALAAGCTMVLKPSEIAPLSAVVFAEILQQAGVPAGVFNLVQGDGPTTGAALSAHPEVDMVSFTGSTRAGALVAQAAAPTIKRVHQELGGKSAVIVLDDADLDPAVKRTVVSLANNSGQSCNAGTRLLVPRSKLEAAARVAAEAAAGVVVGDPTSPQTRMGPLVSQAQWDRVQAYIQKGVDEGADLVAGGLGRPEGLDAGYFVKPTVFSGVSNDMTIAQEEIFGPVLVIIPYDDEDDAVAIANDSPFGLSGYVHAADPEAAVRVARRIRTGQVHVNGAPMDLHAPFGGYKQSGNGREWGQAGLEEFLETKAILGAG